MAKAVQKIILASTRDIPFNKLVLSQSNAQGSKASVSLGRTRGASLADPGVALLMKVHSGWGAVRDSLAATGTGEAGEVLALSKATMHFVARLSLLVRRRLPNGSLRVHRLRTDDGKRIIGRRASIAWAASATTTDAASLTPDICKIEHIRGWGTV